MKSMKKLIPAICMLLIAASLLGSSTFAWFSMNTTVTATGMQVKATASKNLLISTDNTSYSGGVTIALSHNQNLKPVSTVGSDAEGTLTFYKIQNAGQYMTADSYAAGEDTTFQAVPAYDTSADNDYIKTTLYVKVIGETANNLKATFTVESPEGQKLDKAIRVMLVDQSGKAFIYNPLSGTYGTAGKAVSGLTAENKANLGDIKTLADNNTVLVEQMSAETAYQFDVYIWYEGEDTSCMAANAVNLNSATVNVSFSAT